MVIEFKGKENLASTSYNKIDHQGLRSVDVDHKDLDTYVTPFNLKNELGKIKIHVALTKLSKNTYYQKNISNVIDCSCIVIQPETLNLQEEHPTVMFKP